MVKYSANWAMALFLTDNLNYAKINFRSFVTSGTTVIFVFNDEDAERAATLCNGLAKKIEGDNEQ